MAKMVVEFYNIDTNASFVLEGNNLNRLVQEGQDKAICVYHWLPEETTWEFVEGFNVEQKQIHRLVLVEKGIYE